MLLKGRIVNSVLIVAVVFFAVNLADGITVKIIENMNSKLMSSSRNVSYTNYPFDETYSSGEVVFSPGGMAGFYRLTESFVSSLLSANFISEDMIEWDGSSPKLKDGATGDIIKKMGTVIFILVLIALIILAVPIAGAVFCCCRCCGNCGSKAKPGNKKKDFSKKIYFATILICLAGLLLMGVICAFSTNQQMQEGTSEFPENLRKPYGDAITYIGSVRDQASNLLERNYNEFSKVFRDTLKKAGENILSMNNATSINNIYEFVHQLSSISDDSKNLMKRMNSAKDLVTNIQKEITTVQQELVNDLSTCAECSSVTVEVSEIQINDITVPDLTAFDFLTDSQLEILYDAAKSGKIEVENLEKKINNTLSKTLDQADIKINEGHKIISNNLQNMYDIVNNFKKEINGLNSTLEKNYETFTKYSKYVYYVGLTLCCLLLLVPIGITLGLVWGICAKRPDAGNKASCTKNIGSSFLISTVIIIFILSALIGILTILMLVTGLVVNTGICYPLRHPENSSIIDIINNMTKDSSLHLDIRLNNIIDKCQDDHSIYEVFNLTSKYDLENIKTKFDLDDILNAIKKNSDLNTIVDTNFKILNDEDLNNLKTLGDHNLDIQFDEIQSGLNQNLPVQQLNDLIKSINQIKEFVPTKNFDTTIDNINNIITQIENFQKSAEDTLKLAKKMDETLKMGGSSFAESFNRFLQNVEKAQDELAKSPQKILEMSVALGTILLNQAESYLDRVITKTKTEMGKCRPLYDALSATLIVTCDKILLPWNGFWVALFISLLTFVPALFVSVILSSMYKKYIPTKQHSTGDKFRPDKKGKGSRKYNDPYNNYERNIPSNSRYDDMAPKAYPFSRFNSETTRF